MFTMSVLNEQPAAITLGVAGSVSREALPELERAIAAERKHRRVLLDLSEVTLLDAATARFLAGAARQGVSLVNCPSYLESWILSPTAHEPEA
jgi:anti-anti-sigma regulatory factor